MSDSVCVGYAHPGEVNGRFAQCLVTFMMKDSLREPKFYGGKKLVKGSGPRITRGIGSYIQVESGPRIASTRNLIVHRFLTLTTCEWLWMLDADITFDDSVLDKLLEAADPVERPIVTGLYFGGGRSGEVFPIMYTIVDPKTNDGNPISALKEWPPGEVIKIDGTGAGCMLMHRSALEKMEQHYPAPYHWFMETVYAGMEFGEDWTFCVRAAKIGIPIYCHTGVNLGHCKTFEIREENYFNPMKGVPAHPLQDLPNHLQPNVEIIGEKGTDPQVMKRPQQLTRIL